MVLPYDRLGSKRPASTSTRTVRRIQAREFAVH